MPEPRKLLDQVRDALRIKHYSYRTEQTYIDWINATLFFTRSAIQKRWARQKLRLSLYTWRKNVILPRQHTQCCAESGTERPALSLQKRLATRSRSASAGRPKHLPTVLTHDEALAVINRMTGKSRLMARLLYGSGLRLMECLRLRVKDIDFGNHQIIVRDGKGEKDRATVLPDSIVAELQILLQDVKALHEKDLREGYGEVALPYALNVKYPNAGREWGWQYIFPASQLSVDPISGVIRRHHLDEGVLQRARPRLPKASVLIRFAIPSQPIFSKVATISEPCRNCSVTKMSKQR